MYIGGRFPISIRPRPPNISSYTLTNKLVRILELDRHIYSSFHTSSVKKKIGIEHGSNG